MANAGRNEYKTGTFITKKALFLSLGVENRSQISFRMK